MIEVFPNSSFSDPSWGLLNGPDYSIEVNLGKKEVIEGFALHVRGGSELVSKVVLLLLEHLCLRGIDPSANEILTPTCDPEGFRRWKAYRDRIFNESGGAEGGT